MIKAFLCLLALCIAVVASVFFLKSDSLELATPFVKADIKSAKTVANSWFPKKIEIKSDRVKPNLTARSAILVNFDSGEILLEKDMFARLPAASTIKIMTALLVLENNRLTDVFNVREEAAKVGEDSMGLSAGERVMVEELLYGLMLPSGNDAAVAIAQNVAGSEDAFVGQMNARAKELGLKNTKFINASGLDVDEEEQYTTAYDLATLTRFVWENFQDFRRITSTDHIFIDVTDTHKAFDLYNDTNLLTTYPGVKGVKPGFTWDAGYCLVTYAENGGEKLIGVLLGSGNRRGEMKELLDYGFGYWGINVDHPALDLQ